MINNENNEDYITTGELEEAGGGYALTFTAVKDMLDYDEVLVTLEDYNNEEGIMGEKILHGVFGIIEE